MSRLLVQFMRASNGKDRPVYISEDLARRLQEIATARGQSLSTVVQVALEEYLAQPQNRQQTVLEPSDEETEP